MRPSRILKIAWLSFSSLLAGLVVLVGVIVYGIYYLEDPSRGEFFRNLVFDERAFEVTVDLMVEGEPVTITRTVNCVPYLSSVQLDIRRSWKASLESFGKRLKSGDAVIVVAPILCGVAELSFGEDSRPITINDEYVPLIRWIDDPDHPTVIEDYITESYFERPDARIRYRGMTARAVPYKSSAMDFQGLDGANPPFRTRDSKAAYGYATWPIPESVWSTDEDIAEEIRAIEQISELPLELSRQLIGMLSPNIFSDTINRGQGLVTALRATNTRKLGRRRELDQVVPLSLNDDAFELDERKRGSLVFYPTASNPPEGNDPSVIRLRINGKTMSVKFTGIPGVATIYVPESKVMYQLVVLSTNVPNIAGN
jgi:hypothetical protein